MRSRIVEVHLGKSTVPRHKQRVLAERLGLVAKDKRCTRVEINRCCVKHRVFGSITLFKLFKSMSKLSGDARENSAKVRCGIPASDAIRLLLKLGDLSQDSLWNLNAFGGERLNKRRHLRHNGPDPILKRHTR